MTTLLYGSWRPDTAGLNSRDRTGAIVLTDAKNVYRTQIGYRGIPATAAFQTGTGVAGTACGLFAARTSAGGWVIFTGTTTKLYKYNSGTGAFDDYTRVSGGAYNVPVGDSWSWCQFGSKVIAVNINDNPQTIDVDTGATAFTDLAGTPPKARYCTVVNDFVILACINGSPRTFYNSAWNSTTGWTVGTNLCDSQDLPDGHRIVGLSGGEFGWIVQERSIRRIIFQPGSDQAFRVERVEKDRGATGTYGVVGVETAIYMLSTDGFFKFSPDTGLVPIGDQKINRWFQANFDQARVASLVGFADMTGPRILWAGYQSSNSTNFDRVLIYDWMLDDFVYMDQTAQFWGLQATAAQTLEGLNIYGSIDFPGAGAGPGIPASLDSPIWQGGVPQIAYIGTDGKLGFLNGSLMQTALLKTCPLQLQEAGRAATSDVEPLGVFNGATQALRVSRREKTADALNYTSSLTPSTRTGIVKTKTSGRIHNFEHTITHTAGTAWENVQGLEVTNVPDGTQT